MRYKEKTITLNNKNLTRFLSLAKKREGDFKWDIKKKLFR